MLFSHKVGVLYLEHCRIVADDERLSFVRSEKALEKYFSIPHANVCVLLLGPGTSVTHRAAFKMAEEGVVYGFVGGGGTPLFHASLSEYRPTEYCQGWMALWQDERWRLRAAKSLAHSRAQLVSRLYSKRFKDVDAVLSSVERFDAALGTAMSVPEVLGNEAVFAKSIYAFNRASFGVASFERVPQGADGLNKLIDNGNYLAYGLAAAVLWILGIPHALPVTHGMTRRGALVFDVADVIKDAVLLPLAFTSFVAAETPQQHRARCIDALDRTRAMVLMFEAVKTCLKC